MTTQNRRTSDDVQSVTETSLLDFLALFAEVERSDTAAIEFLTTPRTFLAARRYCVPLNTHLSVVPTEELQARLFTPDGIDDFIQRQQDDTAKIKIHVKTGLAKCVRIEFECPKKKKKPSTESKKDIAASLSVGEFSGIVFEAEEDDSVADELLAHPRSFFERQGFFAPPNTRIQTTPSERLRDLLSSERAITAFLDQQAAASFDVHIKSGKGKCTIVTIECDK